MFLSLQRTQTWRFHTKLYKFGNEKQQRPDCWRGCLYINHLSYPTFLTLFIKWLRFLFWSHNRWKPRIGKRYAFNLLSPEHVHPTLCCFVMLLWLIKRNLDSLEFVFKDFSFSTSKGFTPFVPSTVCPTPGQGKKFWLSFVPSALIRRGWVCGHLE